MSDLINKLALVTGAAKGIGRGIALALAEKGADIVLNDLADGDDIRQTIQQIEALNRKAYFKAANVAAELEVKSLFQFISDIGNLDILVNNAGISKSQDIFETTLDDWDHVLKINLTSCYLCSKYAMLLMKEQLSGRIINLSSVVAHQGALYGHTHYAASKSAILGFTKTLARTAAPFGIRVNAIAPGIIDTELLRKTHGSDGVAKIASQLPLGVGTPRDIGLAVAFLAGEGGNYITGATIDINGGLYFR